MMLLCARDGRHGPFWIMILNLRRDAGSPRSAWQTRGSQWFRRREFRRGGGASFRGNSGALRITGTENLYDNFRHLISPIARQPEMRSPLTLGRAEMPSGRLPGPRP